MPSRLLRPLLFCVPLLAGIALGPQVSSADRDARSPEAKQSAGYNRAKETYVEAMDNPVFVLRTQAAEQFADAAASGEVLEGFQYLQRRYQRPESEGPADHIRYTTATMISAYFDPTNETFREEIEEWIDDLDEPEQVWLRYRLQSARIAKGEVEPVLADARNERLDEYHRAASIEALARATRAELLPMVPGLVEDRRVSDHEDRLMIEAAAAIVYHLRGQLETDTFEAACEALFALFDERNVRRWPETRMLVVQRLLKNALGAGRLHDNIQSWRQAFRLARSSGGAGADDDSGSVAFGGSYAEGTRFAYVIDMSDSMMAPLNEEEREEARGAVTSGRGADDEEDEDDDEPRVDWSRVETRFDCAREFLKASLLMLQEDHYYCVIAIGTASEPMEITPRLMEASSRNVERTIAALDEIEAGPADPNAPYGRLRGATDFHGGLRKAFQMTERGLVNTNEHVDEDLFEGGADAIFMLTDGAPSSCMFLHQGQPDASGRVTIYRGLYLGAAHPHRIDYLLPDIQRMNLLRRAEINCIGIGYGFMDLLRQVAEIGIGEARNITGSDE